MPEPRHSDVAGIYKLSFWQVVRLIIVVAAATLPSSVISYFNDGFWNPLSVLGKASAFAVGVIIYQRFRATKNRTISLAGLMLVVTVIAIEAASVNWHLRTNREKHELFKSIAAEVEKVARPGHVNSSPNGIDIIVQRASFDDDDLRAAVDVIERRAKFRFRLEYLSLQHTAVSDDGLKELLRVPRLKHLNVTKGVHSQATLDRIMDRHPRCTIYQTAAPRKRNQPTSPKDKSSSKLRSANETE